MAYREATKAISLDADASLAQYTGISGMPGAASPNYGHMYSIVKITGSHTAGLATSATDRLYGVLGNKPQKLGTAAEVIQASAGGVMPIIAGTGGLNVDDEVTADANGHGVTAATGNTSIGTVVEAAVAGALASVALHAATKV